MVKKKTRVNFLQCVSFSVSFLQLAGAQRLLMAPGIFLRAFSVGLEANSSRFACVNRRDRYIQTELLHIRDGLATTFGLMSSTTTTTTAAPENKGFGTEL